VAARGFHAPSDGEADGLSSATASYKRNLVDHRVLRDDAHAGCGGRRVEPTSAAKQGHFTLRSVISLRVLKNENTGRNSVTHSSS
jgi:hypothetical protein